jgi:uncharacterized membrane protein
MTAAHLILRYIHITAGTFSLVSGTVAMVARKGAPTHELAGRVFGASMLVMATAGGSIAYFINPVRGNALGGMLAFYLVLTGWTAAWRRPSIFGRLEAVGLVIGTFVAGTGFVWGSIAQHSSRGMLDGYPAAMYYIFAGVASLGIVLDIRLMVRGRLQGAARRTRHLWRMCVAMFIATGSFFIGQAKFFPTPIRESGVLPIPVIAVVLYLVFWLVKVRVLPLLRRLRFAPRGASV